uniref:Glycerate kinase n=1 Tax=Candidatus Caldatribacterium californiense TaxID=1454726 RepID=A0A7V4DDY9_9BACT
MIILVCPDSFKGSLQSWEASAAIRKGFEKVGGFQVLEKPLADGGEGTVEVVTLARGGAMLVREVTGPLGEKVQAKVGLLPDGTCVLELAQAAGLSLVPKERRNPRFTTTYGVGELIRDAFQRGCKRIVLGVGGSATCDGGMGALQALGVRFLDQHGTELLGMGDNLLKIARIDTSQLVRPPQGTELIIACDVRNPLYGPQGAAYVYAPQKGAGPEDVALLDEGLRHWARLIREHLGVSVDDLPGGGAAGGIVAGLFAFLGAKVVSGTQLVIEITGLDRAVEEADIVISGEGKVDKQTFFGKTVYGVLELCRKFHKPLFILAGKVEWEEVIPLPEEVAGLFSIVNGPMAEEEAIKEAPQLLEWVSFSLARTLKKFS